jgi:CHAT domain-containing protein
LVLAYWLGASQSWLWALSNNRLELYPLPRRERIAKSAAELLRAITNLQDATQIEDATAALRGALLPAAVQRAAQRRWLVLPDGVTAAVPWALLEKAPNRDVQELASLAALRKGPGAQTLSAESQPLRRIALFGDPIFEANDARIGGSRTAAGQAVTTRAALSLTTLLRLPGTARELSAIASLDPAAAILQRTGADANRSTVLTQSRSNADILHLATHAVLDNEIPALAAVVLSRFDASGRPQPADLRPRDILQMREPPRLVVLSACDTASNPATHAPGLLSLSRAFLTAGSEHVVASLWPVSDAGAVAFMTEFYGALLRDRLSPAAALRQARATMAQSPQFSAPFFWAGFVIVSRQP